MFFFGKTATHQTLPPDHRSSGKIRSRMLGSTRTQAILNLKTGPSHELQKKLFVKGKVGKKKKKKK